MGLSRRARSRRAQHAHETVKGGICREAWGEREGERCKRGDTDHERRLGLNVGGGGSLSLSGGGNLGGGVSRLGNGGEDGSLLLGLEDGDGVGRGKGLPARPSGSQPCMILTLIPRTPCFMRT